MSLQYWPDWPGRVATKCLSGPHNVFSMRLTRFLKQADGGGMTALKGASTEAPRAAIYTRVSIQDQNCEMQVRELREYAARRGWQIGDEYIDTG